jgi:hypothetical protein
MGLKPFKPSESATREFAGWLAPDSSNAVDTDTADTSTTEAFESDQEVPDTDSAEVADTDATADEQVVEPGEPDLTVLVNNSQSDIVYAETPVPIGTAEPDSSIEEEPESESSEDKVWEHATYYCCNNPELEAINVIEAYNMNFSLGSAYKYLIRAGKKTKSSIKDLDKAIQYLIRAKEKNLPKAFLSGDLPIAADIIFEFDLNYYVGVAVSNLLQYLKTDQVAFLETAIDTLTDYFGRLTNLDYESWRAAGGIEND